MTTSASASSMLEHVAAWNWYINLTIDGAIYPSQRFLFGAAFVCQAENFCTHPRISSRELLFSILNTFITYTETSNLKGSVLPFHFLRAVAIGSAYFLLPWISLATCPYTQQHLLHSLRLWECTQIDHSLNRKLTL